MTPTNHLTDEQMYDLLDSTANATMPSHLQNCAECQTEVANLRASLTNFRGAATNLAAIAAPRFSPATRSTSVSGSKVWAASFATATAVLALSIAVFHPTHNNPVNTPGSGAATPTALINDSDEALLDGIQQDLSTSIPPSLEPLAVPATSSEISTQN